MKKIILIITILLSFAVSASAVDYEIIDLGTLGGTNSYAHGINNNGQIVGGANDSSSNYHAFLHENGVMTDLGTLGNDNNTAVGINNSGQIVGYSSSPGYSPFLYDQGVMSDLEAFPDNTAPQAINDGGQIVGFVNRSHAVLYDNGISIDLGTLPHTFSMAYDINNLGQIVGTSTTIDGSNSPSSYGYAFLYDNDEMINISLGNYSDAFGINDSSQVVGSFYENNSFFRTAFLYENGQMTNLGTLGGHQSRALGINNLGQVVGYSNNSDTYDRAFLYDNGEMTDLGTLGGNYSRAYGINDNGQIVGWSRTSTEETHAVLWNPITVVPEPISSTLFIIGGTTLGFRRFRKNFIK